MIIDFHTHILPPAVKADRRRYLAKDAAFAAIYASEKARIVTAEDLIAAMDENGIDVSVIVNYSWSTHEFCVETNDYLLESAAKYPQRLKAFCSVNSFTLDDALKEIERCSKAGAKGIGELRPDLMAADYTQKDVIVPFAAQVKIRYKSRDLPGMVESVGGDQIMVKFEEPVFDVTPGQAAVLYNGEVCLGGGIITNTAQ